MITRERAVEEVAVNSSIVTLLEGPPKSWFAKPLTPVPASPTPQPSQSQPARMASPSVGR